MQASLTWFEIPTKDLQRATSFYEEVLQTQLKHYDMGEPMRIFPSGNGAASGALVCSATQHPSANGTLVYLRLAGDVDAAIARTKRAGGSVMIPKTNVPNVPGEFFVLLDTEGNMVGIHGGF